MDELYSKYAFPSASKLYKIAMKQGIKTNMKDATAFVKKQAINQIYTRKKETKGHICSTFFGEHVQMDLMDMSLFFHSNRGIHWLLTLIDAFTRKIFIYPLHSKTITDICDALESFIQNNEVLYISSDNEPAFMSDTIQDMLHDWGVIHYAVDIGNHHALGIIDRAIQTIKVKIYQYMKYHNTTKYIDELDKIVGAYNDTPHTGIMDYTPNEVSVEDSEAYNNIQLLNNEKMKDNVKKSKENMFEVGDLIRIKAKKHIFTRAYDNKYSDDTHLIMNVTGDRATLDNGETVALRRCKKVEAVEAAKVGMREPTEIEPEILKNDNEETIEELKKKKKINKILVAEDMKPENIIVEKRVRKPNARYLQ